MARPPLATIDDLEVVLGEPVPDAGQAEALLQRASAIVRAYAGVSWLDEDETELVDVPSDVPGVVVAMVERATRNPSGAVQETAGPFSRSWGEDAARRIYMTEDDRLVIRAAVPRRSIGTLATSRGPLETRQVATWEAEGVYVELDW